MSTTVEVYSEGKEENVEDVKHFKRYKGTTLETPMFHFVIEPLLPVLRPILRTFYALRWAMSQPLNIRVLPKWFPLVPVKGLKGMPYMTFGEVLLTVPIVILLLWGFSSTFVSPSLDTSGDVAGYAILATFLTASKANSITSFLFGISFERMIPYHYLSALITVILGCFHTYVAFVYGDDSSDAAGEIKSAGDNNDDDNGSGSYDSNDGRQLDTSTYAMTGRNPDIFRFLIDGDTNFTGTALLLSLTLLALLSIFPCIRRWFFDFWLWTHVLFATLTIIFCFMHGVSSAIFFFSWWMIDLLVRYLIMASCRYPREATIRKLPSSKDVVEISFAKPSAFEYNPGQFVQIAIPQISPFAYHPISISSAPHEDIVTLHIRARGDWSQKLLQMVEEGGEQQEKSISIMLEGPYGCSSVDIDDDNKYKMFLLVCGGIGVTNCLSLSKALIYHHNKSNRKLKKLNFVWATRNVELVEDIFENKSNVVSPLTSAGDSFLNDDEVRNTVQTNIYVTTAKRYNGKPKIAASAATTTSNSEVIPTTVNGVSPSIIDVETSSEMISNNNNNYNGNHQNRHFYPPPSSPSLPSMNYYSGRPNLDIIFDEMKKIAIDEGEYHIGVFGCGPKSLMDQLREACRKHSQGTILESCCKSPSTVGGGVNFDLHMEKFDF